jgi:hypothetical protein
MECLQKRKGYGWHGRLTNCNSEWLHIIMEVVRLRHKNWLVLLTSLNDDNVSFKSYFSINIIGFIVTSVGWEIKQITFFNWKYKTV